MARHSLVYLLLAFAGLTCGGHGQNDTPTVSRPVPPNPPQTVNNTVALLPFRGTGQDLTRLIQHGLESTLDIRVYLLPETGLPLNAFYPARQRYIADSLLLWLARINNNRYGRIIGLTNRDISTRKGDIKNWGVLGLGTCPGTACVISSFRAGKNKAGRAVFEQRMITLALHELGHTYGLQHCPDQGCLMKDAAGKMNLDDARLYCGSCKKQLLKMGVMK